MIIAIDGYEANDSRRVGIGRYAYEILSNIYRLNSQHTFRIYLPNAPLPDMPLETTRWRYLVLSPKRLWTFFRLPLALSTDTPRADVVFSPTHYIPRFVNIPRVMAIMDLSYIAYPELFRPKDLHQLIYWTKYSATHAAKILTISQFSRDAIIKEYGRAPKDVVVTYPGLTMQNSKFKIPASPAVRQNSFGTYILSVGTLQPRKNYVRLIEAFASLLSKHPDLELIIVGKKGWLYEEILEAPRKYGIADKVKFLDFVSDDRLPALYQAAKCFVLPSLYEGFGLPVLEAMAAGTIVVTSNVSSLSEVAGEAGIYVDPLSVESIAKGLAQAIGEKGTDKGKDRIAAGMRQAKQFSWEKAARQTLAILEKI
ncbi:glycosyltransferase family 4 protein [Candidatus Gottesmanbacteria bacterium]|nr:glycosyltransferase family 4 protein [Candidatus Gottesmanbacteria bacterium]